MLTSEAKEWVDPDDMSVELDGDVWWVVNRWCHKCAAGSLGGPLKWGKKGVTVRFRCVYCGGFEWRKVYRNRVR